MTKKVHTGTGEYSSECQYGGGGMIFWGGYSVKYASQGLKALRKTSVFYVFCTKSIRNEAFFLKMSLLPHLYHI